MRRTKSIYNFNYKNTFSRFHVLNTKNTNNTGIIRKMPLVFVNLYILTNIERTLLDSTTRIESIMVPRILYSLSKCS